MPRHNRGEEGLIPGKIRKRGCSPSASSSSSIFQNYRFKRAILVGKRGGSTTPVPTWRLMSSRCSPASTLRNMGSPSQCGGKGKYRAPVSARKLAATLWEMNEMPSPKLKQDDDPTLKREVRTRERTARSVQSGSLPPHLSDPSLSPVSQRMNRSGTGSLQRRGSSVTQRLRLAEHNGALESFSNASFMEVETSRSQVQTPSGSTVGVKHRLKDVSNALTTSKEVLKIINRMWSHEDRPSSSMTLISALHAELERARLQVNQFIREQRVEQDEMNYLIKCLAEEKAAWKHKEREVVEAAIETIAGELDIERKLRRRFEQLNKKLGKELAETKSSLLKAVYELEGEKRARVIMEQIYNEFNGDVDEDNVNVEHVKRETAKVREEVEKEREMMQLADALREERVQMKLSDAKYELEEKNAVIGKLKNQLETFLGAERVKEKGNGLLNRYNNDDIASYLNRTRPVSNQNEDDDTGEVEDGVEFQGDSAESDLHSIELNMDNNKKNYMWTYASDAGHDARRGPVDLEMIGRKSTSGKTSRRSNSLQQSVSDGVDCNLQSGNLQNPRHILDWSRISELDKQAQERNYIDDKITYKSVKGLRDHILSSSRIGSARVFGSPTRQWGLPCPSGDAKNPTQERPPLVPGKGLKSRLADARGEGQNARKSKW